MRVWEWTRVWGQKKEKASPIDNFHTRFAWKFVKFFDANFPKPGLVPLSEMFSWLPRNFPNDVVALPKFSKKGGNVLAGLTDCHVNVVFALWLTNSDRIKMVFYWCQEGMLMHVSEQLKKEQQKKHRHYCNWLHPRHVTYINMDILLRCTRERFRAKT